MPKLLCGLDCQLVTKLATERGFLLRYLIVFVTPKSACHMACGRPEASLGTLTPGRAVCTDQATTLTTSIFVERTTRPSDEVLANDSSPRRPAVLAGPRLCARERSAVRVRQGRLAPGRHPSTAPDRSAHAQRLGRHVSSSGRCITSSSTDDHRLDNNHRLDLT
jgi:hypothetical protein